MPSSSDSALALAEQLRSLSDTALASLLTARAVSSTGIRDFYDLADALLQPESVQAALGRLPRPTLIAIGVIGELGLPSRVDAAAHLTAQGGRWRDADVEPALAAALVLERDGRLAVPVPVTRRLQDWPAEGLPSLTQLLSDPPPTTLSAVPSTDPARVDQVAAERAFGTTASVAEIVAELRRDPARELARGGIALPDSRRLAAAAGVDMDEVPGLLEIAERAGLVESVGERVATAHAAQWLPLPSARRWAELAGAWLQRLPEDVRAILRDRAGTQWGERLAEYLHWLYPAGGEWMRERMSAYLRDAGSLGITFDDVPSRAGRLLLTDGPRAATEAIAFPQEVDKVYLQRDLTVVSPGPLAPRLATRLRGIAESEGGPLASSYRITTASLDRALASGETAQTIRDFLSSIALTGIPQPLEYLVTESANRHGLVRVRSAPHGGSLVRSPDMTLLRTIAVDHALAPLGLSRVGDALASRFDPAVVFWSLAEARYPVAAEDQAGHIVNIERPRRGVTAAPPRTDPMPALIEKLRLASPADAAAADRAWLTRQLDVAIRGKLALTVTVTMPDGRSVDYQLEPASVAGGRLRARDRRTDLERTLPLASITAVGPPLEGA